MNDMDSDIQDSIKALTSFFLAFRANSILPDEPQPDTGSLERILEDRIEALASFFSAFRTNSVSRDEQQGRIGSLERFFEEFSPLRSVLGEQPAARPAVLEGDLVGLANFFNGFGERVSELRRLGDFINVWEVAGLKRVELRNAAVLAWLLDPNQTHGCGSAILDAFIRGLATKRHGQFPLPTKVSSSYLVLTEAYLLNNMESRVDVVIDGPDFVAIIEVKIDAPESEQQVKRYLELAKAKATSRPYYVIFLSRKRRPELSDDPHFVAATWNDVAVAIPEAIKSTSASFVSFGHRLLIQFAQHVRRFERD
jgi:hypothetical protein